MVISPGSPLRPVPQITPLKATGKTDQSSAFQSMLENAIHNVEAFRQDADNKVNSFLSGESDEVHDVVMATQKAELSFELFQGVRNKVVQAYQEIMRMQL